MPIARPTVTSSSGRYRAGSPKLIPHSRSPAATTNNPMTAPAANRGGRAGLAADEVRPGGAVQIDGHRRGRVLLRLELLDGIDGGGGPVPAGGPGLPRQLPSHRPRPRSARTRVCT